jgi:transcriptional regulator with XRE-family HTH domain
MLTDDEVKANIAENVTRLLHDRGWSQSELSRRTGISQVAISLICSGQRLCGSGVLCRIAEAFDVSLDRLVNAPARKILAVAS